MQKNSSALVVVKLEKLSVSIKVFVLIVLPLLVGNLK